MEITNVLKKGIISEKSLREAGKGFYTFTVVKKANKAQIKKAIEDQFKVNVTSIKTLNFKGKVKRAGRRRKEVRMPGFKKALVKLKKGQKIDIFEVQEKEKG